MNATRIYVMSNGGYTGPRWLCPKHMQSRVAAKWQLTPGKAVPHDLTCDDCLHEAPQDTRAVDYVRPDPNSRLPTRAEVARMPGVAPMTKPKQRKAA